MFNLKVYFSILSFFCLSGSIMAHKANINFKMVNFNDARNLAGKEGKLIFVDFYAEWCTPCKWMEQTTFKDEEVTQALNNNFVSVKANIDDATGYDLKNAYDIKYLPTMLIFNSQGQLLDRIEQTLSPRKLMEILVRYNTPENKVATKHDFNTSPNSIHPKSDVKESESTKQSTDEHRNYFTEKQFHNVYRVQVGVFERYERAEDMVKTLRQLFVEQVTVTNEYRNGVPVFKVRIGQFETAVQAENFKRLIKKEYNMDSIVI